ncbi:hypothetical protein [Candidatus Accumulibacter vicinus]|uniref:hypothetical protein n=1 Tax=Candidatus Accumulibacter vicinus TaxID=2954382 RepID=UPI00235B6F04|nr:hypothetical protein [Candidatus Accumulibacter vicinus]
MIELQLPFPPSVNSMWRTPRSGPLAGRTMLSEDGSRWALSAELAGEVGGFVRVEVRPCHA